MRAYYWRGRRIEELPRDELIEALKQMTDHSDLVAENYARSRKLMREFGRVA